jgi:hexosaminidase
MKGFPCITQGAVALFFLFHNGIHATGGAAMPSTIPAVRQWTAGSGACSFGAASRIVVNGADADSLLPEARTFAGDLNGLLGRSVNVTSGTAMAAGDIFLKLGEANDSLGGEGYRLSITTGFEISAKTPAGVFYGTRTLLQLLKQSTAINQGAILDWPSGRWRGMMVDAGRKFYTVPWLQSLIRDLAFVKMNLFHFHLADGISKTNNGGFRLESKRHPEITSSQHYSNAEIASLVELAAKYHVTIVPEVDFPGHANWLYASHKNLLLGSKVLDAQYWALDLSKDSAYILVSDILDEFMPLFPGPFWHLGADEYMFVDEFASFPQLATWAKERYGSKSHANDCYRHFINWANGRIKAGGKTAWAWNDVLLGIAGESVGACTLASDIWIDHWAALDWIGWGGVPPSKERSLGYSMINCSWDIYYILTNDAKTTGDPQWAYDSWALNTFAGGTIPAADTHIKGGKFPVWGDVPNAETEAQVWSSTFMLSRAVAQKCWGSPKVQATYADFKTLATTVARAPSPAVSMIRSSGTPVSRHSMPQAVQVFDLNGALLTTLPAGNLPGGAAVSGLAHRKDRGFLSSHPLVYRLKCNGAQGAGVVIFIKK